MMRILFLNLGVFPDVSGRIIPGTNGEGGVVSGGREQNPSSRCD